MKVNAVVSGARSSLTDVVRMDMRSTLATRAQNNKHRGTRAVITSRGVTSSYAAINCHKTLTFL